MLSMSYCRFENTYSDFRECLNAIQNCEELSEEEKYYAKKAKNFS